MPPNRVKYTATANGKMVTIRGKDEGEEAGRARGRKGNQERAISLACYE